jgi:hypothetical protein
VLGTIENFSINYVVFMFKANVLLNFNPIAKLRSASDVFPDDQPQLRRQQHAPCAISFFRRIHTHTASITLPQYLNAAPPQTTRSG